VTDKSNASALSTLIGVLIGVPIAIAFVALFAVPVDLLGAKVITSLWAMYLPDIGFQITFWQAFGLLYIVGVLMAKSPKMEEKEEHPFLNLFYGLTAKTLAYLMAWGLGALVSTGSSSNPKRIDI